MEFNARYALIALFTLAVFAGLAGFVYWLSGAGGFGETREYRVEFSVPVTGMAQGGKVLFNGIQVGEIGKLVIDPEKPGTFQAIIRVDANTPIRKDTVAGIDYEGLTGSANVLLTGGSPRAPELSGEGGVPPLLIAAPEQSRSWTQGAARVLGRLDGILDENKGRFENILAGLERMTGGGEAAEPEQLTDLLAPTDFDLERETVEWTLAIGEPNVLLSLNTDRLLTMVTPVRWGRLNGVKWTDNLPNLVQAKLVQAFENAGYGNAVLRSADALDAPFRMAMEIRYFHYREGDKPAGVLDFYARIVDEFGGPVAARQFKREVSIDAEAPAEIADAMGTLFTQTAAEIVSWTVEAL